MALARLEGFASQLGVISAQQTGSRRQRSATDSIANLVSALENAKATSTVAIVVFLDIKKSFDCVHNEAVPAALNRYNIRGNMRAFHAFLPSLP